MGVEIVMPKLSDTMEEGKILRWLKKEGDYVTKGEVIAEVETDKADMDLETFSSGILSKIFFQEGETVPVGTVIALLGEPAAKPAPEKPAPAPTKPAVEAEKPADRPKEVPETPSPEEMRRAEKKIPGPAEKAEEKPRISPAAKRLQEEKGIELTGLQGTGPGGRIVKQDVENFLRERSQTEADPLKEARLTEATPAGMKEVDVAELSRIRAAIARRMTQSKQTIPHFYMTREIDMGEAVKLMASLNQMGSAEDGITYNDLVIKACALALRDHGDLNAHFVENGLARKKEINLGVVVALKVGLLVPVVKDADRLSVKEISQQVRGLRERILKRASTPDDLTGGTFTISNLGMFGVEEFSAIINPPQVAILAVAAIKDAPMVKDGGIVAAKRMKVTLSADHRAVDGVIAAKFLERLKTILENPLILIL